MLMFVIAVGALIGAADCIGKNRFGLGEQFEAGFLCLGPVALNMAGIICIAPAIGKLLGPAVTVFYRFFRIDPAMFGSLFANNMGGYPLAVMLADDPLVGMFSGLIVSSMLGAALVYTIPVGLGVIREQDKAAFMEGILIGMIPMPIGAAVGGLMIGLSARQILVNSIPSIAVTALLAVGFRFCYRALMDKFMAAAAGLRALAVLGLGIAAFTSMSRIEVIPGMDTLEHAMEIVGGMGIVQLGSLPMAALMIRWMDRPLKWLGSKFSMNQVAVAAIPVSCINVLSICTMVKDMDRRGIVVSTAWGANAIAIFTAHLAFTQAVAPDMTMAVVAAKLASAVLAAGLALLIEKKEPPGAEAA